MELRMKSKDLIRMLQLMSARLREEKVLFEPLKINFKPLKGKKFAAIVMMSNHNSTAHVVCRFSDIPVEGIEKKIEALCVSGDTLISYFEDCYGADEILHINAPKESDSMVIVNEDADYPTEIIHHLFAEDDKSIRSLEEFPFILKKGIPYYHNGQVKPETEITMDVSEIQKAIKHKGKVTRHARGTGAPVYYDFYFSEEDSYVVIGDPEEKTISPIKKHLNCTVEGPEASVKIGADNLEHVAHVLSGVFMMYAKTDYPIWITQKGDDFGVGYLLAPKAEEEEVDIHVADDGTVEIIGDEEPEEGPVVEIIGDEEEVVETTDDSNDLDPEEESKEEPKEEKTLEEPEELEEPAEPEEPKKIEEPEEPEEPKEPKEVEEPTELEDLDTPAEPEEPEEPKEVAGDPEESGTEEPGEDDLSDLDLEID